MIEKVMSMLLIGREKKIQRKVCGNDLKEKGVNAGSGENERRKGYGRV